MTSEPWVCLITMTYSKGGVLYAARHWLVKRRPTLDSVAASGLCESRTETVPALPALAIGLYLSSLVKADYESF